MLYDYGSIRGKSKLLQTHVQESKKTVIIRGKLQDFNSPSQMVQLPLDPSLGKVDYQQQHVDVFIFHSSALLFVQYYLIHFFFRIVVHSYQIKDKRTLTWISLEMFVMKMMIMIMLLIPWYVRLSLIMCFCFPSSGVCRKLV